MVWLALAYVNFYRLNHWLLCPARFGIGKTVCEYLVLPNYQYHKQYSVSRRCALVNKSFMVISWNGKGTCVKSPATQLLVQQVVRLTIRKTSTSLKTDPLWDYFTAESYVEFWYFRAIPPLLTNRPGMSGSFQQLKFVKISTFNCNLVRLFCDYFKTRHTSGCPYSWKQILTCKAQGKCRVGHYFKLNSFTVI